MQHVPEHGHQLVACMLAQAAGSRGHCQHCCMQLSQQCGMQVLGGIAGIAGAGVGPDAPLMSSGLDSLGAVELHRELCRQAQHLIVSCPVLACRHTLTYQSPTITMQPVCLAIMPWH